MATDVLIVSRTRMGGRHICVGGIEVEGSKSLRLLDRHGRNLTVQRPLRVGQVWSLEYAAAPNLRPPHTEDVRLTRGTRREDRDPPDLEADLLARQEEFEHDGRFWEGPPNVLFQECIQTTGSGSCYVENDPLPTASTGFWIPSFPLTRRDEDGKNRFYLLDMPGHYCRFTFVGDGPAPEHIEAGTLCRVSLARWWRNEPTMPERCYVQLSGVYL